MTFFKKKYFRQRKEKAEQVKSGAIRFVCAVGNATSVASMLVLRRFLHVFCTLSP